MPFTGFTTDKLVGLPPELFTEVLPQIALPSELKVTLHVFYRMSRQRGGAPRRVSWDELAADKTLRRSLRDEMWGLLQRPVPPGSFGRCMRQLVHCATLRGTFRCCTGGGAPCSNSASGCVISGQGWESGSGMQRPFPYP